MKLGNVELLHRTLKNHDRVIVPLAAALPRIAQEVPDEAGTALAFLIALAYTNLEPAKREIWLLTMRGFLDGLPAATMIDEQLRASIDRVRQ